MTEQSRGAPLAKPVDAGQRVLAEARDALVDARGVLLAEREAHGDLRDAAVDRRGRAAVAREQAADERDVTLHAERRGGG